MLDVLTRIQVMVKLNFYGLYEHVHYMNVQKWVWRRHTYVASMSIIGHSGEGNGGEVHMTVPITQDIYLSLKDCLKQWQDKILEINN